jgi:hypothetical protein
MVTFVPLFILVSNLGLTNTYLGLILPFLVGTVGILVMRQFISGLPDELIDAAGWTAPGSCGSSPASLCRSAGRRSQRWES